MGCSIVETFSKSTKPRELEEVLRLEYRSKLLNPKWAEVCMLTNLPTTLSLCDSRHFRAGATSVTLPPACLWGGVCVGWLIILVPNVPWTECGKWVYNESMHLNCMPRLDDHFGTKSHLLSLKTGNSVSLYGKKPVDCRRWRIRGPGARLKFRSA